MVRRTVYPHIAHSGGPGAGFEVVRDLGDEHTALVEETKRTATTASIEVRTTAMMGGTPSPRQEALFGFAISYTDAKGARARHGAARQRDRGLRRSGQARVLRDHDERVAGRSVRRFSNQWSP
jgi:hypothetical protein